MRVLVLDTVAERARGVTAALQECGYTPDRLDTLSEAKEALSLTPYTGMVLSRRLPDGDGIPWLRQCRARGVAIPAVMVTAGTVDDRIQALDAGADDCVQVPVDKRELVARVPGADRLADRQRFAGRAVARGPDRREARCHAPAGAVPS